MTHHNHPEHGGKDGADGHVEGNNNKYQRCPFLQQPVRASLHVQGMHALHRHEQC